MGQQDIVYCKINNIPYYNIVYCKVNNIHTYVMHAYIHIHNNCVINVNRYSDNKYVARGIMHIQTWDVYLHTYVTDCVLYRHHSDP